MSWSWRRAGAPEQTLFDVQKKLLDRAIDQSEFTGKGTGERIEAVGRSAHTG
jgi:hypothetical protein